MLSFITLLYNGTIKPITPSKTNGTIRPCTNKIQFPEYALPGYAKNVTLLMIVANIDIPTAHAGMLPLAAK